MRSYHRRTLVKKESWPLVDGWYWCPQVVIKNRIEAEKKRLFGFMNRPNISFGFQTWKEDQEKLEARLAHACHDGRIRAASGWGIEKFHTAGGIVKIYGKCRFCDTPLSDGIKTIMMMEWMGEPEL
jgi:hypothetical protein